jgi:hypothetical protein
MTLRNLGGVVLPALFTKSLFISILFTENKINFIGIDWPNFVESPNI